MCVIIDTNVWASLFDKANQDHPDFAPLLQWIIGEKGKGKIVYGGTKYLEEIPTKYLKILTLLVKVRKVVIAPQAEVDNLANEVAQKVEHRDFDDPHIIAIILATQCCLIATKEKRAIPYFKDKAKLFYPKNFTVPKIYSNKKHKKLLVDTNIAPCCQPTTAFTKEQANQYQKLIQP